jgi:hypothetical protein
MEEPHQPFGDRTSQEYAQATLQSVGESVDVSGVKAEAAPETLADMQAIADATRNPSCSISDEVDEFVARLAELDDPDAVVKRLPFDPEFGIVMLLVPPF